MNARAACIVSVLVVLGCGSTDDPGNEGSKCANETRDDVYAASLRKAGAGGLFDFVLVAATPAPPAKGDNSWTVEVDGIGGGAPLTGASLTATPFMPDHGHGTPIVPVATPIEQPGQFQVTPINLWMPGLWQVTLEATTSAATDKAVYAFCIEG